MRREKTNYLKPVSHSLPGYLCLNPGMSFIAGQKFAVFDLDGTLYRGNLTWDFFRRLASDGVISKDYLNEVMPLYDSHDKREVENSYHLFDSRLVQIIPDSVMDINNLDDYWRVGSLTGIQSANRLYTYTRNLLARLKKEDYCLIAITHSLGTVAKPFVQALDFDFLICSQEIIDGNRISGYASIQKPHTKGDALVGIIDAYSLSSENSFGVGDTLNDASFLSLVENPIVFNPDKRLRDKALDMCWPIIIERKDTIYRFGSNVSSDDLVILN